MSEGNIRALRSTPPVSDMPGQLRMLAGRIESGEIAATAAVTVLECPTEFHVYEHGQYVDQYRTAGILMWAVNWLTKSRSD